MVVQKRYSNEDTLKIFLKIGLNLHYELHVASYSRNRYDILLLVQ